jgi:hypothetical protein
MSVISHSVAPSLPFLQSAFSYIGMGLPLLIALVGIILSVRRKETGKFWSFEINSVGLVSWSFVSVGLVLLWKIIPWESIGEAPISYRILEFAYFGIAVFSGFAVTKFTHPEPPKKKRLNTANLSKGLVLLVVALISVPIVTIEFGVDQVAGESPLHMNFLNPVHAYYSSQFIVKYASAGTITGTQDGDVFIGGYAAREFSYPFLNMTVTERKLYADLYFISLANINMSDQSYFTLGQDNYDWLQAQTSKVYDKGLTVILVSNDQTNP